MVGKIVLSAAFVAIVVVPGFMFLDRQSRISQCEDAIKRQLRAPASFERVDFERNGLKMRMVFDAANGFGAPLRGRAYCYWDLQDSTPDAFIETI